MATTKKKKRRDKKNKKSKSSKALEKKASNRMTAEEQRELETKIRQCIGQGLNDAEIINKLNLQPHVYRQYVTRIYDIDTEKFGNMNSVRVYTDFVEKSRENVKALDKMQKRFDFRKQFTALVACIKQKHDINKDVVKLGQQLGFIEQHGNEVSVEAEMTFSTMSTEDVKREVQNEVERLNSMAEKKVIEMRPELLGTLGEDQERVRKFIPDNVEIPEEKEEPKKRKTKVKVKLKKRM